MGDGLCCYHWRCMALLLIPILINKKGQRDCHKGIVSFYNLVKTNNMNAFLSACRGTPRRFVTCDRLILEITVLHDLEMTTLGKSYSASSFDCRQNETACEPLPQDIVNEKLLRSMATSL